MISFWGKLEIFLHFGALTNQSTSPPRKLSVTSTKYNAVSLQFFWNLSRSNTCIYSFTRDIFNLFLRLHRIPNRVTNCRHTSVVVFSLHYFSRNSQGSSRILNSSKKFLLTGVTTASHQRCQQDFSILKCKNIFVK